MGSKRIYLVTTNGVEGVSTPYKNIKSIYNDLIEGRHVYSYFAMAAILRRTGKFNRFGITIEKSEIK